MSSELSNIIRWLKEVSIKHVNGLISKISLTIRLVCSLFYPRNQFIAEWIRRIKK
jgi:hypothetical protein